MKGKSKRLLSIDALRGFDMFFISGGASFLYILQGKTEWPLLDILGEQVRHPAWDGFSFFDFIFPLFLFISGLSLSFSFTGHLKKKTPKTALYQKAFKRMVLLILLGILYKNAPVNLFEPAGIRYGSVLGRIGIATFFTSLLYLNFSQSKRLLWAFGILLAYYAALFLIPVPGFGAGDLSPEGNLVGWIDRAFMPGRLKNGGSYDELGLITQLPALCLTIFGSWAGDILQKYNIKDNQKLTSLFGIGAAAIIVGLVWSLHFPINKHLWSSSFILLTTGMSFIVLGLFYWLIDIKGYRKWAFFFKVIGMNSLVIYFAYSFIDFTFTSHKLFGGLLQSTVEPWNEVIISIGALALVWTFLYILYRNKLFVKI